MVVGQDGGALGVAAVTDCAPAAPHVLVVLTRGDTALEIKLGHAAALRFAQAFPALTDQVKHAENAIQAGYDPAPPEDV
jgi:hypothetical protein